MRQVIYIYLILSFFFPAALGQDRGRFKKEFLEAEFFFMTEEYKEAVHLYHELLKTDPENANLHFLIGACYLSIYGEKEKAIPHLERATADMSAVYREGSYKERSAPRETLFALARAYHIDEEFDRAIGYYEQYRDVMIKRHFADIEYVNHQIKSCELAKSMTSRPQEIQFLRLSDDVNRFPVNYNPVVSYDDSTVIFMTERPLYRAIMITRRLPGGGWTEPRDINGEIGSDGDCYPTSLSANGRELYLVRKDAYGADIYASYLENDRFTEMAPLNRNINTDYMETHACVSFNGRQLYFTSDRPGGQGGLDIWVSEIDEDGHWGEPHNLGPKINSHYSEESPFLTARGDKLYFSSQGHATMGGYDYFVAERLPTMRISRDEVRQRPEAVPEPLFDAGWSYPENLGYPISTADDDLFYYPRARGQGAYIATIIQDIHPGRSIYTIRQMGEQQVQIASIRKGEEQPAKALTLQESTGTGGGTGQDSLLTAAGPETMVEPGSIADSIPGVTDPDDYYVLNSILFDFDSDVLSEEAREEAARVYEVMREFPEVRLRLTGHTDAVGADDYNLRLSERRAQAVYRYLSEKGIESSRIEVTAAGETRPIAINRYEDGTDSPEGRRLNRQVSIKFENLQSPSVRVNEIFVPDHLRPKAEQAFSILLVRSDEFLDTIPDQVAGEQTALIITDSAFLYTAGNFNHKVQAMQYLNEVIDLGYPEAGMLEQRDLERLIASLSAEGIEVTASYTIQIMALRNPVPVAHFKPLEGVVRYAGRDGLHRYVYGEYDSLNKALELLPELKGMGYHDAFIMSVLRYEKLSR